MPENTAESVASRRPWRRGLLWLGFLGPFFFASYGLSNWLAARRDDVGSIVFNWEYQIPFLPWSILPYWSIDLFYGLSFVVAGNRQELDAHAKRLLFAQLVSCICFIAFPLKFSFDRPQTSCIPGWLFDVLLGFDKPFNQAPSLHISLLVILWTFYARYLSGIRLWLLRAIAIAIGLSVLTTYQHHFIDIPTGALVGCIAVMLFPLTPQTGLKQRDPARFRIGLYYLAVSLALAATAWTLAGAWLWLMWPGCALAAMAGIYWLGNAALFRNIGGHMDDAVKVLLAPYLIGAWLNSRLWTYRNPAPSEITPDLWLSRCPSSADIRQFKLQALVSCCPEIAIDAGKAPIYSIAMLDLLAPEIQQIEQGVAAIDAAGRHGKTLLFCALGYSRSATVAVAWLLAHGLADSIDSAVARLRGARPGLVVSPKHIRQLESWQAWRESAR